MIKTPTVLVLGAGASKPYGYPLGQELLEKIVALGGLATDVTTPAALANLFKCGFSHERIKDFAAALSQSGRQSVDAFLESRDDFLEVGRHAIANELLAFEKSQDIFKHNDWYQYLFNRMCDSDLFESFGRSNLAVVTFNYDRSLEFYLFSALRNSFQKTAGECAENFKAIPIIHVHGQLGPAPMGAGWPDYGAQITPDLISFSASQIRIIHEANDSTPEFRAAQGQLRSAERICFLGFGYHPVNMRRLLKDIAVVEGKEIYCCGFDLTSKEKQSVNKHFQATRLSKLRWGNSDNGCLKFLREEGVLLD
jgi:hypothetical protein